MGLRFLADHCISNSIIQTLRDGGHEVIRLRDVLPAGSPDSAVIQKAQDSGVAPRLAPHARDQHAGRMLSKNCPR
jgi:hypothetical protein